MPWPFWIEATQHTPQICFSTGGDVGTCLGQRTQTWPWWETSGVKLGEQTSNGLYPEGRSSPEKREWTFRPGSYLENRGWAFRCCRNSCVPWSDRAQDRVIANPEAPSDLIPLRTLHRVRPSWAKPKVSLHSVPGRRALTLQDYSKPESRRTRSLLKSRAARKGRPP